MHRLVHSIGLALALSAFVGTSTMPRAAFAQTADAIANAQKLAREGRRAADQKQHDKALQLFRRAYDSYQEPGYLYNIGIECLAIGRDAEAFEAFERFLKDAQKIPPEFIADANQQQRELRKRLADLDVRCPQEGAHIFVDDAERGKAPMYEPIRVSPGSHRVVVRKDGFEPFQTTVHVAAGGRLAVEALLKVIPVSDTGAGAVASRDEKTATPAAAFSSPVLPLSEGTRTEAGPPSGTTTDKVDDSARATRFADRRVHLAASAGAGIWTGGVPINPKPSAVFTLSGGYKLFDMGKGADFRLGAKLGFTFLSEEPSTDLFVSALVDPMITVHIASDKLYAFADAGLGVLVLSGVSDKSVLIARDAGPVQVGGALTTFELRPGIGAMYVIDNALSVFLSPSFVWAPRPSPLFQERAFTRVEIAAGAMMRL